jgi:hypothetical protein
MKTPIKRILLLAFWQIGLVGSNAFADDIVTLKDGRQISGQVELGVSSQIRIRVGEKSQMIDVDRIQSIQFDPPEVSAPLSAVSQSTSAAPRGITLPIGTEIAVRTAEPIDSKNADLYKEYAASLDDPVVVDGVTVVPANANAILRVSKVQSSGITRRASLSISLIAVTANGRRVDVKTGPVDSKSGSQAKRTAAGAGVGAAAGAAVGAMAGGAVGAGIGAGVGAAAGTTVAVLKGKPVEIKPETRFTYTLTEPVLVDREDPR